MSDNLAVCRKCFRVFKERTMSEIHGGSADILYCNSCYKYLPKSERCLFDDCFDCVDIIKVVKHSVLYII